MGGIFALSSGGFPLVDARPLLAAGLIDPTIGPLDEVQVRRLDAALADDATYARLAGDWEAELNALTTALAADLSIDADDASSVFRGAFREWHRALWRVLGRPASLIRAPVNTVVKAPFGDGDIPHAAIEKPYPA